MLHEDGLSSYAWIACELCESEGPTIVFELTNDVSRMRAEAIKAWNTRTALTLTPEQVERARMLIGRWDRCVFSTCSTQEAVELMREVVGDE